jgi:hypothetical protein
MNKFRPTIETTDFLKGTVLAKDFPINQIALEGPPACGKTSLAYYIAQEKGIPSENVLRLVCTRQTTFDVFTFEKTAIEGSIIELKSKFLELIEKPSVILIDEYKLAQPDIIAGLNCLTDFEQAYTHHDGRIFKRHPDNVLIFSTNAETFAGCKRQHGGFIDRLPTLMMEYSPDEDLILQEMFPKIDKGLCAKLKKMAELVRSANRTQNFQTTITTRGLLMMAQMITNGSDLATVLRAVVKPLPEELPSVNDFAKLALNAQIIKKSGGRCEASILAEEKKRNKKLEVAIEGAQKEIKALKSELEKLAITI